MSFTDSGKIKKIFHIDNTFKNLSIENRKEKRLELLKPALDDFFAWAKEESELTLPKSHYGQAIEYALNQKDKVMRVLEDGRLELDNSMAERTVKPFVIGRNYVLNQVMCCNSLFTLSIA